MTEPDNTIYDPTPLQLERKRRGMTFQQVADASGTHVGTVARTIAGTRCKPASVKAIADALGVDVARCWRDAREMTGTPAAGR